MSAEIFTPGQAELERLRRQHAERAKAAHAERTVAAVAAGFAARSAQPAAGAAPSVVPEAPAPGPPQVTEELMRTLKACRYDGLCLPEQDMVLHAFKLHCLTRFKRAAAAWHPPHTVAKHTVPNSSCNGMR